MADLAPMFPETEEPTQTTSMSYTTSTVLGLDAYASDEELAAVVLFKDYPALLLNFATFCCLVFMLLGIPGNIITILALLRCKKVRSATAVFIMNLSFSDLLFCCFNLPLSASTFWHKSWAHGHLLCRMFPFARYALVAVSLFTILAITINRYIMITHPNVYPKIYNRFNLTLMVASTWIFSFGALVATYLEKWGRFGLDPEIGSCSILPDENNRSPKEFLFVGAFMLPCLAIIVCYARIFFVARNSARKSRPQIHRQRIGQEDSAVGSASTALERFPCGCGRGRRALLAVPAVHTYPPTPGAERSSSSGVDTMDGYDEESAFDEQLRVACDTSNRLRRAAVALRRSPAQIRPPRLSPKDRKLLQMIMAIMLSFMVCYLPITLTKIFKDVSSRPVTNIAGYILIYLTTCINPIIYVVMSCEYRQAYKNLLMCRNCNE